MSNKIVENYRKLTKKEKFDFWIMLMINVFFLIMTLRIVMIGSDIYQGNIEPIFSIEQLQGAMIMLFGMCLPMVLSLIFNSSNEGMKKRIKDLEEKVSELEEKS